jgi:hypothetical protein
MTLKKREKILAIVIAALLAVFALYELWPSGEDSTGALRAKIASLETRKIDAPKEGAAPLKLDQILENLKNKKNNFQNEAILLKRDTDRLPALRSRALPSNPDIAKREYQNWLLSRAVAQLKNVSLVAADPHAQTYFDPIDKATRTTYVKLHFTIACQGTLDELTRFLFDFYSAAHLHKISSINITPLVNKTSQLDLSIVVEALSMPDSKQTDKLSTEKINRLRFASVEPYRKSIVSRKMFEPYTAPKGEEHAKGPPPTPAKIDPLQFSFLTGIIEADGVLEALLYQRTTDEMLKVHEGEEFTIGKVKGKVSRIGYNDIDVEIDGKTHTVSLGNSLKM